MNTPARLVLLSWMAALMHVTAHAADPEPSPAQWSPEMDVEALRSDVRQSYLSDEWSSVASTQHDAVASSANPSAPYTRNEQILRSSDAMGLGISVAVSGNTAFVGAYSSDNWQGAVYVYQRSQLCGGNGACAWTKKQRIVASDASMGANFGFSVAFDGDTAYVGAPGANVAGVPSKGAVYVFTRDTSLAFFEVQKLTAPDQSASDCYYGRSVAVVGTDALIGAPGCGGLNEVINSRGSAYRYRLAANGNWTIAQKFVASDGGFSEGFGRSVALSADTAVIGAESAFQFGHYDVGAVYIYEQQCFTDGCNPAWLETQKLVGTPTSTGMQLGRSVAFDGTTLLAGAEWALIGDENEPIQWSSGAVYAYEKVNGQWAQTQQLLASDAYRNWRFGVSIALVGDTAVVGATGVGWPDSRGAAYVFARTGGTWSEVEKLTASDSTNNDYFGDGVGIASSGAIVVGAHQGLNNTGQGSVYVYETN